MAPPVGPTGIAYCTGGDDEAPRWRTSVDGGFTQTRLKLTAGGTTFTADERRTSLAATLERRLGDRWTLAGTLGAAPSGSLRFGPGDAYDLDPGPLASIAASFRPLDERKTRPFVLFSFSLGASLAWTRPRDPSLGGRESLLSTDGRLGVVVGKTIANAVTPYVAARAFGLPIVWKYRGDSATGTDAYHYQLGAGFSLTLGKVDAHLEIDPVGERSLSAGGGFAF